jgi:hypothetical protein
LPTSPSVIESLVPAPAETLTLPKIKSRLVEPIVNESLPALPVSSTRPDQLLTVKALFAAPPIKSAVSRPPSTIAPPAELASELDASVSRATLLITRMPSPADP